ncbi:MAG: Maf family protein [candidate division Zixibacteria bacterium]|jgi:septum formation protein|nr:Maf family protein [candidate division Zixibacteria bacterium]
MTYRHLRELAHSHPLVLASGSPRRFDLLTELGIPFQRIVPDLEEVRDPGEPPFDYAVRLAEDKALMVGRGLLPSAIALGCDTVVVLGDSILEKPANANEAFGCLRTLSGKQHVVCTALAFVQEERLLVSAYDTTKVFFNEITDRQIEEYIGTGEPMDKAGAYGIQGMGSFLVDRIDGNLDTVIGLPRNLLDSLARDVLIKLRKR